MEHDREAAGEDHATATNPAATASEVEYERYEYEECGACTCCSRLGCHRGPDSACPTDDGGYLCPCTEG